MALKPEYYIRPKGGAFEVAKFEGGDVPSAVYLVRLDAPRGRQCSCWPAKRGPCKHLRMVQEWRAEQPVAADQAMAPQP